MSTLTLGTPATYRITIQGRLDDSWSEQLGGMAISAEREADGSPLTVLTGRLVDQAALYGVLNALYGLGFALLSVERVPIEESDKSRGVETLR
jgi:hypothetical protein